MTQHTTLPPRAFTAIAAVLALSTTPALAQEAVPSATAPVAAEPAVPSPEPSIVSSPAPELRSAPTMVNEPMVQPVPVIVAPVAEPEVAAAPVARTSSAPRSAAARPEVRTVTTTTTPAPAAAIPVTEAIAPTPAIVAPIVEPAPIIPQAEVAAAPLSEPESDNTLLYGGLLAALGLGGAFALTRRRKRDANEPVVFERPVVATPPVQPTSVAPVAPLKPLFAFTPAPEIERKVERVAAPALSGAVPHGEARLALLDRMVAAAPDEANPFTSVKARRKRARIILQSREVAQQGSPAASTPAAPRVTTPVREFEPA